jgi:hypothetical protein
LTRLQPSDCVEKISSHHVDFLTQSDGALCKPLHGLRGTGILLRYSLGYEVDQIANDIGMSRPMVERYMRFKDQMEVAVSGRARPRLVEVMG